MEIFDVCDALGRPTGETVSREAAHAGGIRHRTAHIWVVRHTQAGWEALLQRRSPEKDSFPNQLDTSSAGHVTAGDEPETAALRELGEELGIRATADEITFVGTFSISADACFHEKPFHDREVSFVYVYQKPVDTARLTLQREEVSEVCWQPIDAILSAVHAGDPDYCLEPGGLEMVRAWLLQNKD